MDWHRTGGVDFSFLCHRIPLSRARLSRASGVVGHHEHEPGLAELPMVTRTSTGIPGDALNVGLVGSQEDVLRAMQAADWFPAIPSHCAPALRSSAAWWSIGPITMRRSVRSITRARRSNSLLRSPMAGAQTAAITSDFGGCWKREPMAARSRLGTVTYDRGVGLSRYTGQVTHHIVRHRR